MPDVTSPDISYDLSARLSGLGDRIKEGIAQKKVDVRRLQPGTGIHLTFEPDIDGKSTPPYALKVFYPTSDGSSVNVFCVEEGLDGQLGYVVGARPLGSESTLIVPDQIAVGRILELRVSDPEIEKLQKSGIEKIVVGGESYTYGELVALVIRISESEGKSMDEDGALSYLRNIRLVGTRTILTPPVKHLTITRSSEDSGGVRSRIRRLFNRGGNQEGDKRHLHPALVANMEVAKSKKQVEVARLAIGSEISVKCAEEDSVATTVYKITVEGIVDDGGGNRAVDVLINAESEELFGYKGRVIGSAVGLGTSNIPGVITVGMPMELRISDPELLKLQRTNNEPIVFFGYEYPSYRAFVEAFQAVDMWGSKNMTFDEAEGMMIEKGYLGTRRIVTLPVADFEIDSRK